MKEVVNHHIIDYVVKHHIKERYEEQNYNADYKHCFNAQANISGNVIQEPQFSNFIIQVEFGRLR